MANKKPSMIDTNLLIQAGIDPKTGLPIKYGNSSPKKEAMIKLLRIRDEQDAISRYQWYNLPNELDQKLIEKILYYRGKGCLFYMSLDEKFYFLPYALNGSIDCYGRYTGITPVVLGSTEEKPFINGLVKKPFYDTVLDITPDNINNGCFLLHDYSTGLFQDVIPRAVLMTQLIDTQSNIIPYMETALINSAGVEGLIVSSQDEQVNATKASSQIQDAALNQRKYLAMIGNSTTVALNSSGATSPEEFFRSYQSMDNLRLSMHGLNKGGIFEKSAHMLESEMQATLGTSSSSLQDGLYNRQRFCNIVNAKTGLGIWCEISELAMEHDRNMDMEISDKEEVINTDGLIQQ